MIEKRRLIDDAFRLCETAPRSMADLGGVWGVDGAYSFYARDAHGIESVAIVDTDFSDAVLERCRSENVETVRGLFGDASVIARVGEVDVILLFDVLLHQVAPDWDRLIEIYAPRTSCFVVANPQWVGGGSSFRLLDLGRDEYFANIPHQPDEPGYDQLFDRLDEEYPGHGRKVRDVHYIWQWAITDEDLRAAMRSSGFEQRLFANHGRFGELESFERHGFVFTRG